MAHNPLLGSRISLISKKNIRYEGTLYSINEADATVALENVRSYGTEGRELLDTTGASTFVPPQDIVHAYLLFRGQDIKDLHVHEKAADEAAAAPASKASESEEDTGAEDTKDKEENTPHSDPERNDVDTEETKEEAPSSTPSEDGKNNAERPQKTDDKATSSESTGSGDKKDAKGDSSNKSAQKKGSGPRRKNENMVGSGASLLNRKARGVKGDKAQPNVEGEFDFESNLAEFDKAKITSDEPDEENDANAEEDDGNVYSKDDFFDSISCDALDKANGIDNRLRGAAERNLNLDTFGAVSLGHGRRGGRRNYGGRGGRGRGGRGRGRGRGRGGGGGGYQGDRNNNYEQRGDRNNNYEQRGRYDQGSGPAPRQNNRWKESAY